MKSVEEEFNISPTHVKIEFRKTVRINNIYQFLKVKEECRKSQKFPK
jgi:hypothetical protein